MPDPITPRAAAVLLTRALGHVDQIQPPAARQPIADMLAAGIEMCVVSRSLLGKPVVHVLAWDEALVSPGEEGP